jgi:Tol biopolymer transport system component
MLRRTFPSLPAAFLAALLLQRAYAQPAPAEILSVDSRRLQGNGASGEPVVSADGMLAAFSSEATNLVEGDTNKVADVFLRDRGQGQTIRVSLGVNGQNQTIEGTAPSDQPGISLSGSVVAFRSLAALVPADKNGKLDIYLRDIAAQATELVTIGLDGAAGDGPSSGPPALDAKGQRVAFLSLAGNLTREGANGKAQVYLRDRVRRATSLVSAGLKGQPSDGDATSVAMSADGRFIGFSSLADDLVEGDQNKVCDVFVRDLLTGAVSIASVGSDGRQANGVSEFAALSADGRFVAFASQATNLDPEDRDRRWDVYVHDRATGRTELVSRRGQAAAEVPGDSILPSLDGDGRRVAFQSSAALLPLDKNSAEDVYLFDRALGELSLVSHNIDGVAAGGDSEFAKLSSAGGVVVFRSRASDLAPDRNEVPDVFAQSVPAVPFERAALEGFLFFRTANSQLAQLTPEGKSTQRVLQLTARDPPAVFTIDNLGVLWLLQKSGLLFRFRAGDLTQLGVALQVPVEGTAQNGAAADGFLFIAVPPRVLRVDALGRSIFVDLGKNASTIALALDPFGSLWAAAGDGELNRIFQLGRDLRPARSFQTKDRFNRLACDHLGNLLALAPAALVKYSPVGTQFYRLDLPPARALAVDGRGRAVVVHQEATLWVDALGRKLFEDSHPAIAPGLSAELVLDGLGRAWVSTEGRPSLRRIDLDALPAPRAEDLSFSVAGAGAQSGDDLGGDRSGFTAANVTDQRGDADGDGIPNRVEISNGFDPLTNSSPAADRRVFPVEGLRAHSAGENLVLLSWSNPVVYQQIQVLREGRPLKGSPFPGTTTRILDAAPGGPHRYTVFGSAEGGGGGGGGGEVAGAEGGGGGGLGSGGALADAPQVDAVVVVGDGSEKSCIDLPDHPYAIAYSPLNGGQVVVSSSDPELPVFDISLTPLDVIFPHPAPGGDIRGIDYDGSVPGGRLLFLLSDGRVFRTGLDGSGAALFTTLSGGPAPSPSGYTGLAQKDGVLYTLLGPGYDCLVGFHASSGTLTSESNLTAALGFQVEQSIGPQVLGDQVLVGVGQSQSQEIDDVFGLHFTGTGVADGHLNMPLNATQSTLVTDIEYVPGQGLLALDANNRRLCLLAADLDQSPILESISPPGGPVDGGTVLTLGVKNLRSQADTRVEVGGVEAAILTYGPGADPSRTLLTAATPPHAAGPVKVEVISSDGRSFVDPGFTYGSGPVFVRGNADGQGSIDITDALFSLTYLFLGGTQPPCLEAADANDDGKMDLTDATYTLGFLFLGGPAPPPPYPDPGPDPTADLLGC